MHSLDMVGDFSFNLRNLAGAGVKHFLLALNPDVELIEVLFLTHDEQVLKFYFLDVGQQRFDLGREDIDAVDDQHVVGASGDLVHLTKVRPQEQGSLLRVVMSLVR